MILDSIIVLVGLRFIWGWFRVGLISFRIGLGLVQGLFRVGLEFIYGWFSVYLGLYI